ncbi:MAG TPA: hypothetical protein VK031_03540 [Tissierellaceae bacterium]|nr:hypothetical protein [Tissierellaceae bacterium]
MKELEIKNILPYLPYEVEVYFEGEEFPHEIVGLDMSSRPLHILSPWGQFGMSSLEGAKLVLRPLEDIFKEINHRGKIVTPHREISKILNGGKYSDSFNIIEYNEYGSLRINFGDHTTGYSINLETIPVLEKLYELHFDVRGLIDQGLACNINDFLYEG